MIAIRSIGRWLFLKQDNTMDQTRPQSTPREQIAMTDLNNPRPQAHSLPTWSYLSPYQPTSEHPLPSPQATDAIHSDPYNELSDPVYIIDRDNRGKKHTYLFNYNSELHQWICEHQFNPMTRRPITAKNIFKLPKIMNR